MESSLQFLDDGTEPVPYVSADHARVAILPVPLEKTASYLRGTAAAPGRILRASRQVELYDPELRTCPCRAGIHTYPPVDCTVDMEASLAAVKTAVASLAQSGKAVACLGGEHTLSLAAVAALRSRFGGLRLLHLDAHADLRDSYGGTRFSHACVMRRIHEIGVPAVSVGVRSCSEEEASFIAENNIQVFPAWKYSGPGYPWDEIAQSLSGPLYISVDMDVFDPSEVPGVGTPEPGGLRWDQALRFFRALRDAGALVMGCDLVELCPRPDSIISEFFAARLLYKMIGYFFPLP